MTKKPMLLVIGPTPPPYHGVAVATKLLLVSGIDELFHVVHLDLADRRGIQHVNKPDLYDVALFLRQCACLLKILFRERPQLVHLTISQNTVAFMRDSFFIWLLYWTGARVIIHLHGGNFRNWYEGRSSVMKTWVRNTLKRVARVIVLGERFISLFKGLVSPEKISVVPNGTDWVKRKTSLAKAAHKRQHRVLHLSTLNRLKGTLVLIKAIPLVTKVRHDVAFILAGPWSHAEDQHEAELLIAQENVASFITFTGLIEGKAKRTLFESADLFVFPGVQEEGQPLVVIEAMAASLPVLFTNCGCLRETVVAGKAGLEVGLNDPQNLADKILLLLDNPNAMREMGEEGRRRYEAYYTQEQYVGNMISVFSQVLKESFSMQGAGLRG